MPFFDLASLTKPLVTAPLALRHLDLDRDRREQLGFRDRPSPLTVRQLLSHQAGLPPWRPYTGESLAVQLCRAVPAHPLLRTPVEGQACYSDLGYRLLAELLERELGRDWRDLGAELTGLDPAPWPEAPPVLPEGPDAEAWALAAPELPPPPADPGRPHDLNARAGMKGHAGFGATPERLRAWLERWVAEGFPLRMAELQARAADGTAWGLGLQRADLAPGRFGQLLARLPEGAGLRVAVSLDVQEPAPKPPELPGEGLAGSFWMHFAFTGPALFVRPSDGCCVCLLLHRRGPRGELLDLERLRARRWHLLEGAVAG